MRCECTAGHIFWTCGSLISSEVDNSQTGILEHRCETILEGKGKRGGCLECLTTRRSAKTIRLRVKFDSSTNIYKEFLGDMKYYLGELII